MKSVTWANAQGSAQNLSYSYSTGTNNGKIASKYDAVSGERVTYAYDSLNRLASATAGSTWGEAYGYDSFGNLVAKTVTAGSAPSLSVAVDPATNRLIGMGPYDANGNLSNGNSGTGYDVENRLSGYLGGSTLMRYAYDAQNHRIWSWAGAKDSWSNPTGYTVYLYSPQGQRLAAYQMTVYSNNGLFSLWSQVQTSDRYFGGRRLAVQARTRLKESRLRELEALTSAEVRQALEQAQVKLARYCEMG